jgi:hypothetical protein
MRVNGVVEIASWPEMGDYLGGAVGGGTSMRDVPRGRSFVSGSVVEVSDTFSVNCVPVFNSAYRIAEAWGYLSDS